MFPKVCVETTLDFFQILAEKKTFWRFPSYDVYTKNTQQKKNYISFSNTPSYTMFQPAWLVEKKNNFHNNLAKF